MSTIAGTRMPTQTIRVSSYIDCTVRRLAASLSAV